MHNNMNVNVSGPQQPFSQYKTVVLKGNLPLAQQLTEPNTKYIVKHDFEIGINEIYGDLEFGEATMVIDGVSYHWLIFEAGSEDTYTLTDDTCVFIENGHDIIVPSREIHLPQGGQIRIGSTVEGLHKRAYKFHANAIVIPEDCILEFDGGSLNNGTFYIEGTIILPSFDSMIGTNLVVEGFPRTGTMKWDSVNGKPVWFDGEEWVDALGNSVETKYQKLIDINNKLCADFVSDGETNKMVTTEDKSTWDNKQDAVTGVANNFAGFDADGKLADSGSKPSDFEPADGTD